MVTLTASSGALPNANIIDNLALPANFGECLILSVDFDVTAISTIPPALTAFYGVNLVLIDQIAVRQDFVGASHWLQTGTDRMAAHIERDEPVLWRQNETLTVISGTLDTNAAPTGGYNVTILVTRVRQLGPPPGVIPVEQPRPGRPPDYLPQPIEHAPPIRRG